VGSAVAASATASVEVRLDYVEMNGKRYRAIEDVGTAARSLPAGATVLVKSSLNGTTAQSRKLLDDRTASVVAVLQKAGVKHILIKQAITLRS
jgi:ABC-type sulfate transport system substrate-binding protein